MPSLTIPPTCLLNQKQASWTWRGAVEDRPSGRSMGFFLFTINILLMWRDRKKRKKRIVPAAISVLKYWDNIKSIYISLIMTYRSSVNIDIVNIDPKLRQLEWHNHWANIMSKLTQFNDSILTQNSLIQVWDNYDWHSGWATVTSSILTWWYWLKIETTRMT